MWMDSPVSMTSRSRRSYSDEFTAIRPGRSAGLKFRAAAAEWPGSVRCNARPGLASGTGSSCHGSLGPGWWLTSGPEASIHLEIGNQNFIYVRAPRTWLLTSVKHAVQPRPMQQTPGRCDAEHRQISLSTGLLWLSADPHLRSPS